MLLKVLFIDTALGGHHDYYAKTLEKAADEAVYIVPQKIVSLGSKQIIVDSGFVKRKSYAGYLAWLAKIRRIVRAEKPDLLHFLYGDVFYRYFAVGLKRACYGRPCVVTCHHVRRSRLYDFTLKRLLRAASVLVVHTDSLKNDMEALCTCNVEHVEYPAMMDIVECSQAEALSRLGLRVNDGEKVLLALGGIRHDKGLDVLLKALKNVKGKFHLIVAGEEDDFNREFILKESEGYKNHVTLKLGYLDDHEYADYMNSTDIVVLPYRKIFDGASGPLADGAYLGKMIIGPLHKSLGKVIRDNHLGLTFETENAESLARVIDEALSVNFQPDENYREYQSRLLVKVFREHYKKIYENAAIMTDRR